MIKLLMDPDEDRLVENHGVYHGFTCVHVGDMSGGSWVIQEH